MSSSWDREPLRDLCEFHNGLWTGKNGPFETATVIRNTNFTPDGRIDLSDVAILQVEARHLAKRRLRKGDIIIEKSGGGPKQPVGRVVLFELDAENYSFSNFTSVIRVKNPKTLDPNYLHRVLYWWYVSGLTEPLQRRSTGIRNLDFDAYKNLDVPVPPLDEQKRIVAKLDQAFAALDRARANAEANLADASELFDKRLEQIFSRDHPGWKTKRLDEVCSITSALVDPRQPSYIDAIHVGAGNIESRTGNLSDLKTSRQEQLVSGKFPFDESMVLYSKIRPYLEKVVRPNFSGICSADMYPLAPVEGQITRDFLFWLLLSRPFTDYAIEGSARAGMPKVNRDHLFQYETELPEIEEQRKIVANLDALQAEVSQIRSKYERDLSELDALRQSLLQAAFSGQLT